MWRVRLDFPVPQIATADLDIAVVGQLPSTNLPFGDQFEPRPVKVVGFEAAFRCRSLWKQDLEYTARNPHHAFVFAYTDAELDYGAVGIPTSVRGKTEKHAPTAEVLV